MTEIADVTGFTDFPILPDVVDLLKAPLHYCGIQVLGNCQPNEPENPTYLGNLARRVYSVAAATLFGALAVVATPAWVLGDVVELIRDGNTQFEDHDNIEQIPRDQVSLDPLKTQYMGFSVSTYQNTSNKDFCENSDWGQYVKKHFQGEKAHLAPGQGVDVLTKAGQKELADDILKANGNTLRFSVEWSDIMREDGTFDDAKMKKYVDAAAYFKQRGLTPFVSLHHFVTPLVNGKNIFETKDGIAKFTEYATYVYKALSPHVKHFVTFNEANVDSTMNNVFKEFPSNRAFNLWMSEYVTRNKLEAHKQAYKAIHEIAKENGKEVLVGLTHQCLRFSTTSRWNYFGRIASFVLGYMFHESFLRWAEKNKDSLDLVGVQYYGAPLIGWTGPVTRPGGKMVDSMQFRFYPEGMYSVLKELDQRLGKEIKLLVTETGTAGKSYVNPQTAEEIAKSEEMDERRAEYFSISAQAMRKAQNEGINLIGALKWAPQANFEWAHGFNTDGYDFGSIARDPKTGEKRYTQGFEMISKVFSNTIKAQKIARSR